ncbi:MAG TPA: Gfo/Idh/MocA family oxidoreductase [Vicinamibacterales bacterium]|nr:Gfo/Idh/MocA family oxidoreductase [Vicinamibacterales bacterium]
MLRWGLLGTSRIGRSVIPALRESGLATVAAVGSRSAARGGAYAAEYGIPRAYDGYERLLADDDIDVVYNALPNHLHAEWTVRALRAGRHVLCEKPLAITLDEVDAIAAAARETGRVATEAFMYRHHPLTSEVESIVRSGRIGALRAIRGAFTFVLAREGDVRFDAALGGGSLWDVGCYPVSYACLLTRQMPVDVFGWQRPGPMGIDLAFAGQLRFGDGVVAQFDSGFDTTFRSFMEIAGDDGLLRVDRAFKAGPASRLTFVHDDRETEWPFEAESPYLGEIRDITAAIADRRPPRVTLDESRGIVAVLLALYESARMGAPRQLR